MLTSLDLFHVTGRRLVRCHHGERQVYGTRRGEYGGRSGGSPRFLARQEHCSSRLEARKPTCAFINICFSLPLFNFMTQVSRNKDGSMTLKLADFGLAMEVSEPIYMVCGTPTYVAPEILAETGQYATSCGGAQKTLVFLGSSRCF